LTGAATTIDYSNGATLFPTITPVITVGGAGVNSAPVIAFSVGDGNGNPYAGFQNIKRSDNGTYPNFAFAIAKLVPGANGSPSKWVNYIVTNTAGTQAQRPGTDNTGTLQYLGQGIYQYTFFRDITTVKAQLDAICNPATDVCPGSGSPKKADLGDVTFDSNALHRVTIQFYGDAPGTGSNTPDGTASGVTVVDMRNPVNAIYDFIPATGKAVAPTDAVTQRLIVDKLSCNECHGKLGGLPGTESESFHSGSRFDPKYCVVCHTDQRKAGRTNVTSTNFAFPGGSTYVADGVTVGDFPVLIHRVHKGEELIKQNYNYAGVMLNETFFPQDLRNCTKCHDSTAPKVAPQASNFQTVPSRLACGACHDGIDFATAQGKTNNGKLIGHIGGIQTDDSKCALCHDPASIKSVYHIPVTPPNPNNSLVFAGGSAFSSAAWIASNRDNLPPGAIKVSYDIQSVKRDTSMNPVIVFRMLQNGVSVPFNNPASATEMWNGFFGAPSVYFVWAVAQDGVAAPADFNASASAWLKGLWNGTGAGTLTGPDANGFYTATLTGVTVPDGAVMLSGGLGYTYTLSNNNTTGGSPPLTQIGVMEPINSNLALGTPRFGVSQSTIFPANPNAMVGGLVVVTPDMQMVASAGSAAGGTGGAYTGRRPIVDDTRCNSCHQELGLFTAAEFHAGQRNDATTCGWCHTPNRTSSAWSADSAYFIHAIHGSDKREKPFTWHASAVGKSFDDIGYPGILSKCETCHLPGTYDFSAPASSNALPNRLYKTVGVGTYSTTPGSVAEYSLSPYVQQNVNYGSGPSYSSGTGTMTAGAATNLVMSPIATACFACHDSDIAKQHMENEGGSLYRDRTTAFGKTELCMFCHSPSSSFGLGIKAVHDK
jgi:OmcA/MtrC family decaheme c-type cytochrome